jgi:hypothetical protein
MRLVPWGGLFAMSSCLATLGACILPDALAGPRVEPVVITYHGDTVLTRGTRAAIAFTITANGAPFPDPRLVVSSSNPATFAVIADGDSLDPRAVGRATLTVRVESSILTDSMPTLSQSIRVRP